MRLEQTRSRYRVYILCSPACVTGIGTLKEKRAFSLRALPRMLQAAELFTGT